MVKSEGRRPLRCGGVRLSELVALILLPLLLPAAGLADAAQDARRGQQEKRRGDKHNDADPQQDPHHLQDQRANTVLTNININSKQQKCFVSAHYLHY